jgi:hypothetical protein
MAAGVPAVKCEAGHTRPPGLGLLMDRRGSPGIEDGTDEDAADGILVVQIRHLRAIPGEVSECAAREAKLSGFVARPGKAVIAPPMRARMPIF